MLNQSASNDERRRRREKETCTFDKNQMLFFVDCNRNEWIIRWHEDKAFVYA